MYMQDWIDKLHAFLQINNKNILEATGRISHELAKEIAGKEYDKYSKKLLKNQSKADIDFESFVNKATKVIKNCQKDSRPLIYLI